MQGKGGSSFWGVGVVFMIGCGPDETVGPGGCILSGALPRPFAEDRAGIN